MGALGVKNEIATRRHLTKTVAQFFSAEIRVSRTIQKAIIYKNIFENTAQVLVTGNRDITPNILCSCEPNTPLGKYFVRNFKISISDLIKYIFWNIIKHESLICRNVITHQRHSLLVFQPKEKIQIMIKNSNHNWFKTTYFASFPFDEHWSIFTKVVPTSYKCQDSATSHHRVHMPRAPCSETTSIWFLSHSVLPRTPCSAPPSPTANIRNINRWNVFFVRKSPFWRHDSLFFFKCDVICCVMWKFYDTLRCNNSHILWYTFVPIRIYIFVMDCLLWFCFAIVTIVSRYIWRHMIP